MFMLSKKDEFNNDHNNNSKHADQNNCFVFIIERKRDHQQQTKGSR